MASTNVSIVEGHFDPNIPQILPHDKMYNIQIGTKLFKISGASLSSDGPSYFTNYFIKKDSENKYNFEWTTSLDKKINSSVSNSNNENNTPESSRSYASGSSSTFNEFLPPNLYQTKDILFIDRSPQIFELIYQHLQGYFINIKDEVEYTMLIADAVYYNLPRLKALLKNCEYFYSKIGDKSFKFPKELLRRNGDNQNYFQVTTDSLYVDVENLILVKKLLRPPPHSYSFVPRSPVYFEMLLNLLNGSKFDLDDGLRESLIQECKFYRFLNLEQRLIKCQIEYNPFLNTEEISLSLYKIVKRGLTISDYSPLDDTTNTYVLNIKTKLSNDVNNSNNIFDLKLIDTEPSLKKPKLRTDMTDHQLEIEPSNIVSNWNFVSYKRLFIDDYERVLNFQLNTKECSIIFDNIDSKVYLNLVGDIAEKFESVFSSILLKLKNINLQDYKVNCSAAEMTKTNNFNNYINTNNNKKQENFIKFNTHLVIPACLDFANIVINDQIYSGNFNEYFNKTTENALDITNSNKFSEYTPGSHLHLSKSIWKLAINPSNRSIVLLAVRLQAYTTLKAWGKQLEFL